MDLKENVKQYRFQLTKKETFEFCVRAIWEHQRLQVRKWILIAALCVLETLLVRWVGAFLVLALLALVVLAAWRNYFLMKKDLHEKMRTMWVENGMLKVETDVYGEIPCSSVEVIRETKRLLMLGHFQGKKRLAWYPMPRRVFGSRQEKDAFLSAIQEGKSVRTGEAVLAEKAENALFYFRFYMDEEKWTDVLAGATKVIRSGTFGNEKGRTVFLIVYGVMLAVLAGSFFILDGNRVILILLFLLVMILLALLRDWMGDPEKKTKRQIKSGLLQNDVCGEWETIIFETGVTQAGTQTGRSQLPWEALSWLVETRDAFYLFQEDKKHFMMIPFECLESYEQAEALKRLCAQKGLNVIAAKEKKYAPGWFFILLFVAVIIGYLGAMIGLAIRDGSRSAAKRQQAADTAAQDWAEEFDPADYPDYVPLEEQVEVLRSLGFTVPEKVVESVRGDMEEYGMRVWAEGYSYTWLLSELGTPVYNEDWEIVDYSDEVFWFDFEGWDLDTDYIEVLEGMKALAAGSLIDSVKNIRENTDTVNWEEGSGEVTVSFEGKGRPGWIWNIM